MILISQRNASDPNKEGLVMEEKILNTRKNGMAVLLLTLLGYVASIALFIYSITLLDADPVSYTHLTLPTTERV